MTQTLPMLLQEAMQGLQEEAGSMHSALLCSLVTPGQGFPDPAEPLEQLLAAADWEAAASEGRVKPTRVRSAGLQDLTASCMRA